MTVDLNCDMGESFGRYSLGNDFEILQYVSSCNIACGFHAGDPKIIIETIKEAQKNEVRIGAHPSYPDLQGFGRRRMFIPNEELIPIVQYQIAVISELSRIHANGLHHIKPHGALYNHAFSDENVAEAIIQACLPWRHDVRLFVQFGSHLQKNAQNHGIQVWSEGFADRRYNIDLNLISRTDPGALHHSIDDMISQVVLMIKDKKVQTPDGHRSIDVRTICIHGDHPKAVKIVKELSKSLHEEGITIG